MMDSIMFTIGDVYIQLSNGEARFWRHPNDVPGYDYNDDPGIVIPIARLQAALGAAFMLNRPEMNP